MKPGVIRDCHKRIRFLGLSLDCISCNDIFDRFDGWLSTPIARGYSVAPINVNLCVLALLNPEFRTPYREADLLGIDSIPFLNLARGFKNRASDRLYAPDMMIETAKIAHQRGYKFYFYGGLSGATAATTEKLKNIAPDLQVVGTSSSPFRTMLLKEDADVCKRIPESGANIVRVGLASPIQDVWIAKHLQKLPGCILIACGETSDFFSGRVPQAPHWLRSAGLKWLFRLTQDPKRLWKRYTLYNLIFLVAVTLEILGLLHLACETR